MLTLTVGWMAGCTPAPVAEPGSAEDDPHQADPEQPEDPPDPGDPPIDELVPTLLDETFRIDLSRIDVVFDWVPDVSLAGHAELVFTMRTGQDRAVFHFDPPTGAALDTIGALTLDGEALDPSDPGDLLEFRFEGSAEDVFELQRDLSRDEEHTLLVDWSSTGAYPGPYPGWFQATVDDTVGSGNERMWPTINSPEELAQHTIEVRIDAPREYVMIGSGLVASRTEDGLQIWSLDTVREISSYTVMLAAMPLDEVILETFDVGSTPVTIASTIDPESTLEAVDRTRNTLEQLEADFGPFPMPALQILLVSWPDGMEYYGATTTGLGSLTHELAHMYWGCSAVNRTWRDTWMDEAIDVWWEVDQLPKLPQDFHSGIVADHGEIETGFDMRAYFPGSAIIDAAADALGGREPMIVFLAGLHQKRAFAPYTTDDFVDDLVAETGEASLRDDFQRWVNTP